jgi:leader peptidase (prepilin peptidase)/N-methyltransferase
MNAFFVLACAGIGVALGPFLARASRVLHERYPMWSEVSGRAVVAGHRGWWCGAACGSLFALGALRWGTDLRLVPHLVLFCVLIVASAVDFEHLLIPNRVVFPALLVTLPLIAVVSVVDGEPSSLGFALVGAVAFFGGLLLTHLVNPRGMGFGDVKLALLLGLFLGWAASGYAGALLLVVVGLMFASLAGSVIGVVLLVRRGRGVQYPFGPWLAFGTVVALLAAPLLAR